MYLHALATAVPAARVTQADCWELVQRSGIKNRVDRRGWVTISAILRGECGIDARHFAVDDLNRLFDFTADELNETFRREAPKLASQALARALSEAGLEAGQLDALVICTCTGYLCPGVTSYVSEALGLPSAAYLQDLVGLGCGAAIPALRSVEALLAANPRWTVACIAVEICSAAFYLDNDPGVLISACLFGDGAAASLWRATPGPGGLRAGDFSTLHQPAERDRIRFEQRDGRLRNLLHPSVPGLAAAAVSRLFADERARPGRDAISRIIAHGGGRDVVDALEAALPGYELGYTRSVLRAHGNMSSPSVLFALDAALRAGERPSPGADWWLTAFGAGFSAHGCRFGAVEQGGQSPPPQPPQPLSPPPPLSPESPPLLESPPPPPESPHRP